MKLNELNKSKLTWDLTERSKIHLSPNPNPWKKSSFQISWGIFPMAISTKVWNGLVVEVSWRPRISSLEWNVLCDGCVIRLNGLFCLRHHMNSRIRKALIFSVPPKKIKGSGKRPVCQCAFYAFPLTVCRDDLHPSSTTLVKLTLAVTRNASRQSYWSLQSSELAKPQFAMVIVCQFSLNSMFF